MKQFITATTMIVAAATLGLAQANTGMGMVGEQDMRTAERSDGSSSITAHFGSGASATSAAPSVTGGPVAARDLNRNEQIHDSAPSTADVLSGDTIAGSRTIIGK